MKVICETGCGKTGQGRGCGESRPGFGRNYLIPRKIAVLATPGSLKVTEIERLAQARRDQRDKTAAGLVAREIVKLTVSIKRKAGEGGALYGSVTAIDIADFLNAHKIDVDKRKIHLEDPIKTIGEYQVPIRLHREVTVPIRVW